MDFSVNNVKLIRIEGAEKMRIVIYGAGAIGCLYGSQLTKCRYDVTFVARNEKLEYLHTKEINVHSSYWGNYSVAVKVVSPQQLPEVMNVEVIILTVKATALDDVISDLEKIVTKKTKVVCFLNGLGNEEKLAEKLGGETIIGAVAHDSVIMNPYGHIWHVSDGGIGLGAWANCTDIGFIAAMFKQADFSVDIAADVKLMKWKKLFWNIVYNPITALSGKTVGEVLEDPDLRCIMTYIVQEYLLVAEHAGISMEEMHKRADGILMVSDMEKDHKTSMLQDFEAGREMELEAIIGYVIKFATERNISLPNIENLYYLLKQQQLSGQQTPD